MRFPPTIIPRTFVERLGIEWPPGVVEKHVYGPGGECRFVTIDEVRERRKQRQAERLERIRAVDDRPDWRPAYVWSFYVPGWLYMGWHLYVVTRHEEIPVTFRCRNDRLALSIMQAVPLGLLPHLDNLERWMELLAKKHPRKKPKGDPRRAGTVVGWLYRRERFVLERPAWDR